MPLIAHYVAQDNVFLALKLQQNKGSGDIAPIQVTFNEPEGACIPLILTAIAASADMPVYAWMLDESRVVPKNFFHVGVNLAKLDWFNQGANYIELATDAVNQATRSWIHPGICRGFSGDERDLVLGGSFRCRGRPGIV